MFEAHSDLEIFRIRLGKALDYEFHEDYIGGYFSEKGPRDVSSDVVVRLSCCIEPTATPHPPSPGVCSGPTSGRGTWDMTRAQLETALSPLRHG